MEEIYKIIFDYNKRGRIIDEDGIYNIIDILIKELSLDGYVKELTFSKSMNPATYTFYDKVIDFNYIYFDKAIGNYKEHVNKFIDVRELMFINSFLVSFLIHEIRHAIQCKKYYEEDDLYIIISNIYADFKRSRITNHGISDIYASTYISNFKALFEKMGPKLYCYDPSERDAELYSCRGVISILESNGIKDGTLGFFKHFLNHVTLKGYKVGKCPLMKYMSYLNSKFMIEVLPGYDKDYEVMAQNNIKLYGQDTVINYGLPISKELYLSLSKK